jgi:hypothetical protein
MTPGGDRHELMSPVQARPEPNIRCEHAIISPNGGLR